MDTAQEMLTMFNYDPDLIKKIITDEESWVYGYDIEEIKEKSKPRAISDTKKCVSEGFRGYL